MYHVITTFIITCIYDDDEKYLVSIVPTTITIPTSTQISVVLV